MCKKHHLGDHYKKYSAELREGAVLREITHELDVMFNFGGQLDNPSKGRQIVYTDDEGHMMLLADDPWQ
ncbi:hypothetical protein SUGI_0553420 [Cryptomeria japonica]|nr:hypothetical protein SUGI_0553420 [Cryptomeria japonica]